MSKKKLTGLVVFLIGIALIILSFYISNRVTSARANIDASSKALPSNPLVDAFAGAARGETNKYDGIIRWSLIGGIALGVVGGYMLICCRCRAKRR